MTNLSEFLRLEAIKEIEIDGKKFKIKPLSLEDFAKVSQLIVSLGLEDAPFPVDEKTIKRIKFVPLTKLSKEIMKLTTETRARTLMRFYKRKGENPLAA